MFRAVKKNVPDYSITLPYETNFFLNVSNSNEQRNSKSKKKSHMEERTFNLLAPLIKETPPSNMMFPNPYCTVKSFLGVDWGEENAWATCPEATACKLHPLHFFLRTKVQGQPRLLSCSVSNHQHFRKLCPYKGCSQSFFFVLRTQELSTLSWVSQDNFRMSLQHFPQKLF